MVTRDEAVFSRPFASIEEETGKVIVRASSASHCRRLLWYSAHKFDVSNPLPAEKQFMLNTGNALEPVIVDAMRREKDWDVVNDQYETVFDIHPAIQITGHVDSFVKMEKDAAPIVGEIKTRGSDAYRRWLNLGAERSHPGAVAQMALYIYGVFGKARDGMMIVMNTGERVWDYEIIPAERVEIAYNRIVERLSAIADWSLEEPPERDHDYNEWQCQECVFKDLCWGVVEQEADVIKSVEGPFTYSDAEVRQVMLAYADVQKSLKELEEQKDEIMKVVRNYLEERELEVHELPEANAKMVTQNRTHVDYKVLNNLIAPEIRDRFVYEVPTTFARVFPKKRK